MFCISRDDICQHDFMRKGKRWWPNITSKMYEVCTRKCKEVNDDKVAELEASKHNSFTVIDCVMKPIMVQPTLCEILENIHIVLWSIVFGRRIVWFVCWKTLRRKVIIKWSVYFFYFVVEANFVFSSLPLLYNV